MAQKTEIAGAVLVTPDFHRITERGREYAPAVEAAFPFVSRMPNGTPDRRSLNCEREGVQAITPCARDCGASSAPNGLVVAFRVDLKRATWKKRNNKAWKMKKRFKLPVSQDMKLANAQDRNTDEHERHSEHRELSEERGISSAAVNHGQIA